MYHTSLDISHNTGKIYIYLLHNSGSTTNAEVMTVGQFVEYQLSKPNGSRHCAILYGFLTTLDIDGTVKRITAHRWYFMTNWLFRQNHIFRVTLKKF